jgi:hypothetical protein
MMLQEKNTSGIIEKQRPFAKCKKSPSQAIDAIYNEWHFFPFWVIFPSYFAKGLCFNN